MNNKKKGKKKLKKCLTKIPELPKKKKKRTDINKNRNKKETNIVNA